MGQKATLRFWASDSVHHSDTEDTEVHREELMTHYKPDVGSRNFVCDTDVVLLGHWR